MKTLIILAASVLTFGFSQAQFTETFEQNLTSLTGNCWRVEQVNYTTTSSDIITGSGSAYTNPPTSSTGERALETPFLNISSTSLTVSFKYKTSSKIAGNATRTIDIGLVDRNGVFTSLQVLTMDKNSPTTVLSHNATYTIATPGTYRLALRIGGATGDGNSRVIFDDLYASASAYYGPTNHCNPAGVAVNDTYSSTTISNVSGNVITNDNLPADGEVYTAVLSAAPASGTLTLAANGSFTYTPSAEFTGGSVIFSYYLVDNGYTPSTSNIAFVTINYSTPVVLPIKLLSFSLTSGASVVELTWKVDANETGNYFEVERSVDGKYFTTLGRVSAKNGAGVQEYSTTDIASNSAVYYRLKIVNKDQSVTYSRVLVTKAAGVESELTIRNNPATSSVNFTFQTSTGGNSTVRIFSISGVKIYEQKMNVNKGINSLSVSVQSFPSGTYVMVIDATQSKKFIKQ
jgi:hypothetical protein